MLRVNLDVWVVRLDLGTAHDGKLAPVRLKQFEAGQHRPTKLSNSIASDRPQRRPLVVKSPSAAEADQ